MTKTIVRAPTTATMMPRKKLPQVLFQDTTKVSYPIKIPRGCASILILRLLGVTSYPTSRANSPTQKRRELFHTPNAAKSYTIEPIIALPHPEGTHALAASVCLTHFLTGSEDGFIRDYDIFGSANGKTLLTAQQRSYSGLADVNLKAGVLRSWWENGKPVTNGGALTPGTPASRSSVYSMTMQADALWGLSGTKVSRFVNLRSPVFFFLISSLGRPHKSVHC